MKKTVLLLLAGILLGFTAASDGFQRGANRLLGAWFSHDRFAEYEISIGLDPLGKARKPQRVEEVRRHLNLPAHYGDLIDITAGGEGAVLWYQTTDGMIRNVIIPDAATRIYRIEKAPTARFKSEMIRP